MIKKVHKWKERRRNRHKLKKERGERERGERIVLYMPVEEISFLIPATFSFAARRYDMLV